MVARAQDRVRIGERIGQVRGDDVVGQIGVEAVERIALRGVASRLAHDRRADDHAQRVERAAARLPFGSVTSAGCSTR